MKNFSKIFILAFVTFSLLFTSEAAKKISFFSDSESYFDYIYDFSDDIANSENTDVEHEEKNLYKLTKFDTPISKLKTSNFSNSQNLEKIYPLAPFSPPRS